MVEAIIFSCSSGSRYRNFVLATKTNVPEIGFACGARLFTWPHHGGTRFTSSPLREAENAVIRREFFVGLGTLAAAPLSLMPSPNLSCGKSEALYGFL